ncbi:MAG: hypothetical protein ACR2ML_07200 [Solirubrobacteraceae bacterium]
MFRESGMRDGPLPTLGVGEEEPQADDHLAGLVLDWVNDLRREHMLGDRLARLPIGRMLDAEQCVVARAVHPGHCMVEDDLLTLYSRTDEFGDSWISGLPPAVMAFLKMFDAGGYPHLAGD